jgi:Zn-dependent protease with chaperone function
MPELAAEAAEVWGVEDLLSSMSKPLPRKGAGFFYQMGLLIVTGAMVMLPVLYAALIGVVGWGVWHYAVHYRFLLANMHGGFRLFMLKILLYAGPVFAGMLVVLFMIKPFFARRAPASQPLALNPELESNLFAFIARICQIVGAPMPRRVDLDCQFNASAGFRRGALSFLGNDLVLTIGIPLVAGLNLGQFAAVLAHEFGHFTQGFAMRLSYVIRTIDMWFCRVIYERDAWDLWLDQMHAAAKEEWWMSLMIGFARLGVWFSRGILKLLMLSGHAASCFLTRQMEYNADAYAVGLAGSNGFESMTLRIGVLSSSLQQTYKNMRTRWNTNRHLPSDFSDYFLQHDAIMPPEKRAAIENTLGLQRTGTFDTHPAPGDRIRLARRAKEKGVFYSELPAAILFNNFPVISKQATRVHYQDDLGIEFVESMLEERPL